LENDEDDYAEICTSHLHFQIPTGELIEAVTDKVACYDDCGLLGHISHE
jgi:hypothetical protein